MQIWSAFLLTPYLCRPSLLVIVGLCKADPWIWSGLEDWPKWRLSFHLELFHVWLVMNQQQHNKWNQYKLVDPFPDVSLVPQGRHIQNGQCRPGPMRNPWTAQNQISGLISQSYILGVRVLNCHHRRSFFLNHYYLLCFYKVVKPRYHQSSEWNLNLQETFLLSHMYLTESFGESNLYWYTCLWFLRNAPGLVLSSKVFVASLLWGKYCTNM